MLCTCIKKEKKLSQSRSSLQSYFTRVGVRLFRLFPVLSWLVSLSSSRSNYFNVFLATRLKQMVLWTWACSTIITTRVVCSLVLYSHRHINSKCHKSNLSKCQKLVKNLAITEPLALWVMSVWRSTFYEYWWSEVMGTPRYPFYRTIKLHKHCDDLKIYYSYYSYEEKLTKHLAISCTKMTTVSSRDQINDNIL